MDADFDFARSPLSPIAKGLEYFGNLYGRKRFRAVTGIERSISRLTYGPHGAYLAFDPESLQFGLIRPAIRAPVYVPFPWTENQIDHTAYVDEMGDAMLKVVIKYSAELAELRLIESFSATLHESLARVTDCIEMIERDRDRMWDEVEVERAQMRELDAEFAAEMQISEV